MTNRTKTYLAGDWTGDKDLIDKLHEWNDSEGLALNFTDVHSLTSSSDATLNCNIKKSLRQRMNISKTFVLIVGKDTKICEVAHVRFVHITTKVYGVLLHIVQYRNVII